LGRCRDVGGVLVGERLVECCARAGSTDATEGAQRECSLERRSVGCEIDELADAIAARRFDLRDADPRGRLVDHRRRNRCGRAAGTRDEQRGCNERTREANHARKPTSTRPSERAETTDRSAGSSDFLVEKRPPLPVAAIARA
jgi:hypothetical protein